MYDSNLPLNAKLSAVIRGSNWCWPPAQSDDLVEIQYQLCGIQPNSDAKDLAVWAPSSSEIYNSIDTWNWLREKRPLVHCYGLFWFKHATPKQSFTVWLSVLSGIFLRTRLVNSVLAWNPEIISFLIAHILL